MEQGILNTSRSNLSQEEMKALKTFMELQKNSIIKIKPADKGAGILAMNCDDYIESYNSHLQSKQLTVARSPSTPKHQT